MPSTPIRTSSSKHRWVLALLAVAVAAGAYVWWARGQARIEVAASDQQALSPAKSSAWFAGGVAASQAQAFFPKEPVGETRPPDISEESWDALNKALDKEPNKDKERNRLVSYLRFQRAVAQWSQMKDGPDAAGRQALAHEIVGQLPTHMANSEVNAGEANLLLAALAPDMEPDPAKQQAWIEGQRKALQSTQTPEQVQALAEEQRKNKLFAEQQAEIVSRYQNTPAAERDPVTLEKQLQALREKIYGS
jgi:hypothetical protein